MVCQYHFFINGNLFNAVTRGDGKVGEIVTDNVKTIKDIPHKLKGNYPNLIEIRGEIFMKKANFEELNKSQIKKMGKFLLIQEMLQQDLYDKKT